MDEVAERIYSLGEASGREEGREEGRAEGRVEAMRDTAVRLQKDGFDIHKIASLVNVNIDTVCRWLSAASVVTS